MPPCVLSFTEQAAGLLIQRNAQRLRNSGERRRASATRRAVPKVLTRRRKRKPPPWTPNTDAPGWSLIEMLAYLVSKMH